MRCGVRDYNPFPCERTGLARKLQLSITGRFSIWYLLPSRYTDNIILRIRCRCAGCFPSRPADVRKIAPTVRRALDIKPASNAIT